MSAADHCQLTAMLLADFIAVDAAGKINVIGGGVTFTPMGPAGATPPLYLLVVVDVDRSVVGQDFPFCIQLRDLDSRELVSVPAGPNGEPEALRIQQLARIDPPMMGSSIVREPIPGRMQFVAAFPNGLPLAAGHQYGFELEIDGVSRSEWCLRFFVPAPPTPPIFGGPTGPASIPGVSA